MGYSFKDEVIKRLPTGHRFVTMTSVNEYQTEIYTVKDAQRRVIVMNKVNITSRFEKFPTLTVGRTATYNDLYDLINKKYGLGIQQGLDYYNSDALKPSSEPRYVELPINGNSYCYRGVIRCYVLLDALFGTDGVTNRDLHKEYVANDFNELKFRSHLVGTIFTCKDMFKYDRLTDEFIEVIVKDLDQSIRSGASYTARRLLDAATIVDVFNDGLTDVVLLQLYDDKFPIRFHSPTGQLPVIKNNEKYDLETSTANAVLVGIENSVAENPVEGKGETNIQQSDSDISLDVVSPKESTPKKKTRKKKK
ncbi:hypothetical protein D5W64_12965 [Salmonella enterica subsp. enterica serovar Saintpaul]|nr:hypothetical protein [Salmonella enterica subsp. enterica serovar Saintpaul]